MRKVAIVGVGTMPWRSRRDDETWRALGMQAVKNALADARLSRDDIDSVVYSIYCDLMLRQQSPTPLAHDYLGMEGKPAIRIMAGAAGSMFALYAAYCQVASGMADIVLQPAIQKGQDFYSFETRSRGDGLLKGFSISGHTIWVQPIGPGAPGSITVTMLNPHIERFGGPTPEQLAKASVKNHKNALVNPEAQLKVDLTVDDVLNSRIMAWPTTMYQCCLYSDGAAALILASEERAREITDTPIWLSGIAVSTDNPNEQNADKIGRVPAIFEAGRMAYKMAGIKDPLHDLDIMEVHDICTGLEVLTYEELGLCELGQAGRLIDEGVVEKDGLLPVNVTGGRVAAGHVGGVSGTYSAATVVRQLREQAGAMQVPIRSGRGLVEAADGGAGHIGVAILERE
jgi:acetyl-CoA C-acetyltransferase